MKIINLGDVREAPSKDRKKGAQRLEFLVMYIMLGFGAFYIYYVYNRI